MIKLTSYDYHNYKHNTECKHPIITGNTHKTIMYVAWRLKLQTTAASCYQHSSNPTLNSIHNYWITDKMWKTYR